jgi:hypothetical protein
MDVKVLSKLGQVVSERLSESTLVGNSMLVRLRSGTIALLGLITAVGLILVIVISQQGWPEVSSGPLPQRPPARFVQHETISPPLQTTSRTRPAHPAPPSRSRRSRPSPARGASPAPPEAQPELASLHQVAESTGAPVHPVNPPSSNVGSQAPQPPASSPAPVSAPPEATTVAEVPALPADGNQPVAATAEPESEDESHGHYGGYQGHYPYPAGSPPPWTGHGHDSSGGQEEFGNEEDSGAEEDPNGEEDSDDEGSTGAWERCDHGWQGIPGWAGN